MSLKDELTAEVESIFSSQWTKRDGQVVPEPEDLKLGNDGVNLEATILYADMAGSTVLVDSYARTFSAEVYKTYMTCAAKIIKYQGGYITAYDGDRIMAIFIGDLKNTTAAKAGLQIQRSVTYIINPALKAQYGDSAYQMSHSIGIDTSTIMASRIGVRNDNDIVWVGRAANYGAKLSSLPGGYTYITGDVFDKLNESSKYGGNPKKLMWEQRNWTSMNNMRIYRSSWSWGI